MLPGAANVRISRDAQKDYVSIEYEYVSRSGEIRHSTILANAEPNSDGTFLFRNPDDIAYGGPLTLERTFELEAQCKGYGYDITR